MRKPLLHVLLPVAAGGAFVGFCFALPYTLLTLHAGLFTDRYGGRRMLALSLAILGICERLGLAKEPIQAGVAAVVDAQVPVFVVAAMFDHEVVHAQFPSEAGERENLVSILRHEHHLKTNRASELIAALHGDHVGYVLDNAVKPLLFHTHNLGVAFFFSG